MQFPQTVEYALRIMTQFAISENDHVLRAEDLRSSTKVPPHFLSKILRRLVRHNLLTSQRGCGGGFLLSRDRKKIFLSEIFAACNYSLDVDRCLSGLAHCNPKNPCAFHYTWAGMKTSFHLWARRVNLSEVASNYRAGTSLLMPAPEKIP